MTNKEYLISQLGFAPDANAVSAALIDAGVVETSTYDAGNSTILKKAAVQLLQLLLSTADTTNGIGETAFAIKYDRNAILSRIKILQQDLGINASSLKARHLW